MSRPHRKPTASSKKVAKIAFTGAEFQRADHGGSCGRSAGAHAGCPPSAGPVKAQYIIRAGALAFALGVGAAVANTPAVAFAEPTDSGSSSSSPSSSPSSSSTSSTGQPTENTRDTTNQANDSEPDTTPANTSAPEPSAPEPSEPSAPEPSEPSAPETSVAKPDAVSDLKPHVSDPETSVAKPDAVSDLKPHVSDPETSVAKPGIVSAVEIGVRATKSAQPTKSRKAAKSERPATEAEPPATKQQAVTEVADAVVAQPDTTVTPKTVLTANLPPAVAVPMAKIPAAATAVVQQVVMSVPEAQVEVQDTATKVVTTALQTLALSPFASSDPAAPVPDSPVMWAMLAMARKRPEVEVPSSFGRLFAVGVSSEEPALAPLNQQALSQDPNAGFNQGISMAYRPIDGANVDVLNPSENAAGAEFIRLGSAHFVGDDGLRFADLNPRMISNVVVGQGDPTIPMPENFSGMMYAWGQFLDHDLDLAPQDGKRAIDIEVPDGDPVFRDGASIPLTRTVVDENSGLAINSVTGWLDGSQVYGSTAAVAASLRGSGGHLLVENNSLPVVNGQFLAGDVRAAENPSLTALQVLFVREHNSQVDRLHDAHPNWGEDKLYEEARAIVTAELANITYTEFLPKLVGDRIDPYTGYKPKVDATISEEFAGAAFRFGHSIVSGDTERIDNDGNVAGRAEIPLREAFFMTPDEFNADGGADGFLRHLAAEASQTMDVRIVEDLRNFLSDPPDGMDLAAINIQRGRDLGLGTLNETRKDLGLKPYTTFEQITNDAATVEAMKTAFGTPDNVDLWTGGLAEQHAGGSLLGPTFTTIIADQFERLRDGDPYYFENALDPTDVRMVKNTTLSDIITRNTDATDMQADVFMNVPRGEEEEETDVTL